MKRVHAVRDTGEMRRSLFNRRTFVLRRCSHYDSSDETRWSPRGPAKKTVLKHCAAEPVLSPTHSRTAAFHYLLHFRKAGHRCIAWGGHREGTMSSSAFDSPLRVLPGQ